MDDNLTAALIMSFSLIVFIIALSITMYMFSQVTTTSEILVANADTTKYYDNIQLVTEESNSATTAVQEGKERVVDSNTVIPTLYRYYKENFCVKLYDATTGEKKLTDFTGNNHEGSPRLVHIFDLALENDVFQAKSFNKENYYTDPQEKSEAAKKQVLKDVYCNEPSMTSRGHWESYKLSDRLCMYGAVWGSDNVYIKQRVDFFVNGSSGYINGSYVNFENNPLARALKANNYTTIHGVPQYFFTEKFVSYTYTGESIETEEGDTLVTGMKPKDKIVIIYTIYNNSDRDGEKVIDNK